MAIVHGLTDSFKKELLEGAHNFTGYHTFKLALYSSDADLGPDTTAYTATGEISGTGYSAGGASLTPVTPAVASGVAYVDFADVSWTSSTFTARGALIYNSSASNAAVAVLNFGSDRSCSASTFTITFPSASPLDAIIRIR